MIHALVVAVVVMTGAVAEASAVTDQAPDTTDVVSASSTSSDEAVVSTASTSPRRSSRQWPPTTKSAGVPDGTQLRRYRGSCTITKANKVIERRIINCSPLSIRTTGVVIKKSKINGAVQVGTQDDLNPTVVSDPQGDDPIRVKVLRSEIDVSAGTNQSLRPISSSHYVVRGSYLHGSYSGGECHNACTIKWSYVQGSGSHASGLRILRNGTLKHNTIWCKPRPEFGDDGGCSGNLTMYEEFGIPHHNVVRHNYFPAGLFWYSLKFNGSDKGHIRIVNNRFGRPKSGRRVADDWDRKASNVWRGNKFPGGRRARP